VTIKLLDAPPTSHTFWTSPKIKGIGGLINAVGAGCVIAAGADIGDKTSVKRSVIGPGCVLGSNVKVRGLRMLHVNVNIPR
jgi:NDP-sugar pyrophosphorylase family protein